MSFSFFRSFDSDLPAEAENPAEEDMADGHPDDHPEAGELGMKRGEYGQGHGKQHSWGYYGDPGTNGVLKEKKNGGFVVITHGNPANMPMYETVKELQDRLTEIAKEVFS